MQDTVLPKLDVADFANPAVLRLIQIATFGWNGACTPQHAGKKKNSSYSHSSNPTLMEHVAHSKARIEEAIITYVDGELPVWLRKPKFIVDVANVIKKLEQIVGTFNYYKALLEQEVALANAWAGECQALVNFAASTVTPEGLRTAAEEVALPLLNHAIQDIGQQIQENIQSVGCLI